MTWNVRIFISLPFQRISITNRVLSLFDCFTTYYNCMTWNFKKLISHKSPFYISVHKDHKSCSYLIWPFYDLLQHYDIKCQKTHYLHHFSAQVSQIVFFPLFDRFTAYYNPMTWNVRKLISPPFQCATSITNRVFRFFHLLMAYYNIMTLNFLKTHISAISVHKYHKSCS